MKPSRSKIATPASVSSWVDARSAVSELRESLSARFVLLEQPAQEQC